MPPRLLAALAAVLTAALLTPPPAAAASAPDPDAPTPADAPPPMTPAGFAAAFAGRCLWFSGDSITRESHFALLRFAFGCDAGAAGRAGDPVHAAQGRRAAADPALSPAAACATVRSELRNRRNRVTVVPVSDDPADDVVVVWLWAPHLDEHLRVGGGALPRELARGGGGGGCGGGCDAFILNSGAWEMPDFRSRRGGEGRVRRRVEALFAGLRAAAEAAGEGAGAAGGGEGAGAATPPPPALRRVFWRQMYPGDGKFRDADVRRYNGVTAAAAAAAGIRTWDARHLYLSVHGRRTRDGLHPNPPVQVRMMRALLPALAAQLREAGEEGSGGGGAAAPRRPNARARLAEFRAMVAQRALPPGKAPELSQGAPAAAPPEHGGALAGGGGGGGDASESHHGDDHGAGEGQHPHQQQEQEGPLGDRADDGEAGAQQPAGTPTGAAGKTHAPKRKPAKGGKGGHVSVDLLALGGGRQLRRAPARGGGGPQRQDGG